MSSRNHFTKMDDAMKEKINLLLYEGWSPEQIHGRLKYEGVDIVSHETIYKYVYEDKRLKGNGKGLYKHLRRKGRKYAKRGNQYKGRGIIVDRVDIDQRPNIVNEKIRFDDLEGDTIIGKNRKGTIETIIDRYTGFLWMSKLSGKEGRTRMQNRLIRQYIPKGSDFAEVSDDYIAEVQDILNNRPRKRLGFRTPLEVARVLHPEYF